MKKGIIKRKVKKEMAKRCMTVILSTAMAVSLMGCGSGPAKQSQKEMKEMVYQAKELKILRQISKNDIVEVESSEISKNIIEEDDKHEL